MRVLVAAVHRQPSQRGKLVVQRDAAAFNLAQIFPLQQNGRRGGGDGDGSDGAVYLSEKVAGADAAPAAFRRQSRLPAGGAFAEQIAVGQGQLVAHLRGAIEFVGRGLAESAESGGKNRPMTPELAREADAGIEEALVELRRLAGGQ